MGSYVKYEQLLQWILQNSKDNSERQLVDTMVQVASISAATSEDQVLVAINHAKLLILLLSYYYLPKQLLVKPVLESQEEYREYLQRLLPNKNGYQSTNPKWVTASIPCHCIKNTKFNLILYEAESDELACSEEPSEWNRYDMLLGVEFVECQSFLKDIHHIMNRGGRLVIKLRACWFLLLWQQLEVEQLQLEYQEYHIYMKQPIHPNRMVWLRFSYKEQFYDRHKQEQNLLRLMKDNYIDCLYANRNQCLFPYHSIMKQKSDQYLTLQQNRSNLQYFFTEDTTLRLAQLCEGYVACLVVPSIAVYAYSQGRHLVLFEKDNRFRSKKEMKYVKYDLNLGLNPLIRRRYEHKFDTVICDPPFNIKLDCLAKDIKELIKLNAVSKAYVVYPKNREGLLCQAMERLGFMHQSFDFGLVEYIKPPKLVHIEGKDAIRVYQFQIVKD